MLEKFSKWLAKSPFRLIALVIAIALMTALILPPILQRLARY